MCAVRSGVLRSVLILTFYGAALKPYFSAEAGGVLLPGYMLAAPGVFSALPCSGTDCPKA